MKNNENCYACHLENTRMLELQSQFSFPYYNEEYCSICYPYENELFSQQLYYNESIRIDDLRRQNLYEEWKFKKNIDRTIGNKRKSLDLNPTPYFVKPTNYFDEKGYLENRGNYSNNELSRYQNYNQYDDHNEINRGFGNTYGNQNKTLKNQNYGNTDLYNFASQTQGQEIMKAKNHNGLNNNQNDLAKLIKDDKFIPTNQYGNSDSNFQTQGFGSIQNKNLNKMQYSYNDVNKENNFNNNFNETNPNSSNNKYANKSKENLSIFNNSQSNLAEVNTKENTSKNISQNDLNSKLNPNLNTPNSILTKNDRYFYSTGPQWEVENRDNNKYSQGSFIKPTKSDLNTEIITTLDQILKILLKNDPEFYSEVNKNLIENFFTNNNKALNEDEIIYMMQSVGETQEKCKMKLGQSKYGTGNFPRLSSITKPNFNNNKTDIDDEEVVVLNEINPPISNDYDVGNAMNSDIKIKIEDSEIVDPIGMPSVSKLSSKSKQSKQSFQIDKNAINIKTLSNKQQIKMDFDKNSKNDLSSLSNLSKNPSLKNTGKFKTKDCSNSKVKFNTNDELIKVESKFKQPSKKPSKHSSRKSSFSKSKKSNVSNSKYSNCPHTYEYYYGDKFPVKK